MIRGYPNGGNPPARVLPAEYIGWIERTQGIETSQYLQEKIYYARLILEAENEIMERKIVELDARPSDCLALVVRCGAPFYVVRELWDTLDDMTSVLREMRESGGTDENESPDLGIL